MNASTTVGASGEHDSTLSETSDVLVDTEAVGWVGVIVDVEAHGDVLNGGETAYMAAVQQEGGAADLANTTQRNSEAAQAAGVPVDANAGIETETSDEDGAGDAVYDV